MDQANLELYLIKWTEWHAIIMMSGIFLMILFAPPVIIPFFAFASFSSVIVFTRPFWTPGHTFGIANIVTSIRLATIVALLIIGELGYQWVVSISILLLCLDAIDGMLARMLNLTSTFGAFFDKEVDAFFMLALCVLLYRNGYFEIWILIPGLMRYLFVLFLRFSPTSITKENRSQFGKWVFFLMVSVLILDFTPVPMITLPLTVMMTCLLIYSFFVSV